jgi:hypothetical protein
VNADEQEVHRIALEAEDWLSRNDPEYAETSKSWRNVNGKLCEPPGQEVPFGGDVDLEILVEEDAGRWVPSAQRKLCESCG